MSKATSTGQDLRIDSERMLTAFNELAQVGATVEGGVSRPTFGEAHLAARQWFREQIEETGLDFRTDGAGNHSAFLPASVIARSEATKLSVVREGEIASQSALAT